MKLLLRLTQTIKRKVIWEKTVHLPFCLTAMKLWKRFNALRKSYVRKTLIWYTGWVSFTGHRTGMPGKVMWLKNEKYSEKYQYHALILFAAFCWCRVYCSWNFFPGVVLDKQQTIRKELSLLARADSASIFIDVPWVTLLWGVFVGMNGLCWKVWLVLVAMIWWLMVRGFCSSLVWRWVGMVLQCSVNLSVRKELRRRLVGFRASLASLIHGR